MTLMNMIIYFAANLRKKIGSMSIKMSKFAAKFF